MLNEKLIYGRIPEDEEPDTCIFGAGRIFWGRVVGSPEMNSSMLASRLCVAWNMHDRLATVLRVYHEAIGDAIEQGMPVTERIAEARNEAVKLINELDICDVAGGGGD